MNSNTQTFDDQSGKTGTETRKYDDAVDTIRIFIKQPHFDPFSVEIDPSTTLIELKQKHGLTNHSIQRKGKSLRNGETLVSSGVQENDTLYVFAQKSAAYQQSRRVKLGNVKRHTAQHLHEQTQSIVMHEASKIHERHDRTDETLRKLIDYHEKAPSSKPGQLDLMVKVLLTFEVQRMNHILKEKMCSGHPQ